MRKKEATTTTTTFCVFRALLLRSELKTDNDVRVMLTMMMIAKIIDHHHLEDTSNFIVQFLYV